MRRQIKKTLLVSSWSPEKNKEYSKKGRKPELELGHDNAFAKFLSRYVVSSNKLRSGLCRELGISANTLSNYLYKGRLPGFYNLMSIVHRICKNTGERPEQILTDLYLEWKDKHE